jgi:alcohol dehydrogenase
MIKTGTLDPQQLVSKTVSLEESPAELAGMGAFNTRGVVVVDQF